MLAGELLILTGSSASSSGARLALTNHLDSGRAMEEFRQMVEAQGGNLDGARPRAPAVEFCAPAAGYLASIDGEQLGQVVIELGGGRRAVGDSIDPSVGLEMLVRIGEPVEVGTPLVRVFTHRGPASLALLEDALAIEDDPPRPLPLVAERI